MKLHFGVVDIPYAHNAKGTSTGDVAVFLENRYHIMETFFQFKQSDVVKSLEESLKGSLENMIAGAPVSTRPFASATAKIETQFKQFITSGEIETIGYPGIPTRASLERKSLRFKNRVAKGKRPSFVDTGLYVGSFKAWVD